MKIRPLMKDVLAHMNGFSMIHQRDAHRIKALGAPEDRIWINGNAKFDVLFSQADKSVKKSMGLKFNIQEDEPVFIAGSTRDSEEETILTAYEKIIKVLPRTLLILAPRHISRTVQIESLVKKKGFEYQLKTHLNQKGIQRTAPVIILDTMGELQLIYSIASVVFCGGSLVPLGGHNILEAAVWGKPVFYGASMEDFFEAKALLEEAGGGLQVKDGTDLAEKVIYYLTHPRSAEKMGLLARKAAAANKGAAKKHANVICELLGESN